MRKALSYITLGLAPLVLITVAQGPLLHYQTSLQTAKQQYAEALQESRRRLSDLGHELRALPTLTQNLGASDASSRILNGFIAPGRMDRLAIYNQECQLLAHSDQGVSLNSICPLSSPAQITAAQFQWRSGQHGPTLDLVTPLSDASGKTYFLLASTILNDQWLYHYPSLKSAFSALDLHMGRPDQGKILFQEEGNAQHKELATLSSTHPVLMTLPILARPEPLTLSTALLIALGLFGVTLAGLVRDVKKRRREVESAVEALQHWAGELVPDGEKAETLVVSDEKGIHIKGLQDRMSRLVKKSREQVQKAQHESQVLQQKIVNLESRVLEQQAEHAWLTKARSLHQQMQACGSSYLQRLVESQSLGEDLSHLAAHQIARPAQQLYELSARWEAELLEMNARKFVRSLSERIDQDGVSELESSLASLLNQAHEVSNAAINMTMLSQKLLRELKENGELATHWFRMMGHGSPEDDTLQKLLVDGQSLIELQGKVLQFENHLPADLKAQHLNIPASTFTSALFHCQMALIENANDSQAQKLHLGNQVKMRDGRVILVLSLRAEIADEFLLNKAFSAKAEQHVTMALQLLQGFPIKLTKLPALNGVHALALLWDEPKAEAAGAQDMHLHRDLSQQHLASLGWE